MYKTMMQNVGVHFLNIVQMGISYGWSEKLIHQEISDGYDSIRQQFKDRIKNIGELTADELKDLGFSKWSNESDLYLIPIWFYDFIPDGIELTSISGEKAVKGQDYVDMDTRFGRLAYGIEWSENNG